MSGYYDRNRRNRNFNTGLAGTPGAGDSAGFMSHPQTHVGNTTEYMASGYPFICSIAVNGASYNDENDQTKALGTGDIISMQFPYVTRWIMLRGYTGSNEIANGKVFVSFSETGVGTNTTAGVCQADLAFVDVVRLELKCSKLFFRLVDTTCDFIQVIAGLTNVPSDDFVVETSNSSNVGVDKTATNTLELNATP